MDHCKFQGPNPGNTIIGFDVAWSVKAMDESPLGVVDNNEFYNARITSSSQSQYRNQPWFSHWRDWDDGSRSVFLEDNYVNMLGDSSLWTDCSVSARLVVRFNTIEDGGFEAHGARTRRGCISYLIYENDIDNTGSGWNEVSNARGGSGVIFNNRCSPVGECVWYLWTERCDSTYAGGTWPYYCDTTASALDTSPHPIDDVGWICRDFAAGRDGCADEDEDGSTLPCAQESLPWYFQ